MLKQRLLTILLGLPLLLCVLIYSTALWFTIFTVVVLVFSVYEWLSLMDLKRPLLKVAYMGLLLLAFALSLQGNALFTLYTAIFWWFLALLWVMSYPKRQEVWTKPWILAVWGVEVLVPFGLAMVLLRHEYSVATLLFLLALVWSADTGAYIIGKCFGRRPLLRHVSPGKTVEGFLGGVAFAFVVAACALFFYPLQGTDRLIWLLICASTIVISVLGDLAESMLKRHRGVKDSSHLLPGHGGVLDRIDSLTAAAPWFLLMMKWAHFSAM